MRPYVIGIAGPSCSGKTSVAKALASMVPAAIVGIDAYYRDLAGLPVGERSAVNFDHPDAFDLALLSEHLRALAAGKEIPRPVYDFATHTRRPDTEPLRPAEYLIVEGLLTLHWDQVRDLCAVKVYLEAPEGTCLHRRELRDVAERGRTPDFVRHQFAAFVRPMAERFVVPTRAHADLVLDGSRPVTESAAAVLARVRAGSGT